MLSEDHTVWSLRYTEYTSFQFSILTIMTGHVSYEVSYVVESQYDWVRPILLERMATHPRTDSFTPVGQVPLRLAGRLRTRSRILSRKIGLAQSY